MGTIRLYHISNTTVARQFILREYPQLEVFNQYAKRSDVKRLNVERYFAGIKKKYTDYKKMLYGPIFGTQDPRNGFIYENVNDPDDILLVPEEDIPITYETCMVLSGDLGGILQTDTTRIKDKIIVSYDLMDAMQELVPDSGLYMHRIREEWELDKSFLIIE